jgi:hypothetical protein
MLCTSLIVVTGQSMHIMALCPLDKRNLKEGYAAAIARMDELESRISNSSITALRVRDYDGLPSGENKYIELIPRESVMRDVKKRILDMGITSPFVVVQNADRETFLKKRRIELSTRDLYSEISKQLPTVEISFRQIRRTDTQSPSTDSNNVYLCTSLEEQAAIIRLSSFCIFMSSGDFRSLHYVPSFCGRDNYSITSSSIISNSAIGLWNEEVFMFGGKIIPMTAESLIVDVALKNNFLGFCNSRLQMARSGE